MNRLWNALRLVLIISGCQCVAFGNTNYFMRVKLPSGICLDLPRNWSLIEGNLNTTIETSAQAVLDLSGIDLGGRITTNLITAVCRPGSMYASVRIDVIRPAFVSADEARRFQREDLEEMGQGAAKALATALPRQGSALKEYISTTKEELAGFPALVCHYRRTDAADSKEADLVWIIQMCDADKTYRLNLAYRESEAGTWKPVIERIKSSVEIPRTMDHVEPGAAPEPPPAAAVRNAADNMTTETNSEAPADGGGR